LVELNGIEASRSPCERDTVALHEQGAVPPEPPTEVASSIQSYIGKSQISMKSRLRG
jgi:hypothetical protein